jgi:two-component system, OmpR family, response regulator SaeR
VDADVLVIPAEHCNPVYNEKHIVIAYGADLYLKPAFLAGCRDFIKEPWMPEELYFRVLAHTKDYFGTFRWMDIHFFPFYMQYNNKVLPLSNREYTIMYILVKNKSRIVSRSEISLAVWDQYKTHSRAIDMHISSLRKKLHKIDSRRRFFIETIHGKGYLVS